MKQFRNERGQIIIAAPFIILFIVVGVFFMINISTMTEQKIRIQVATDATARDAAYIQALALETITELNTAMIAADVLWIAGDALEVKGVAEIAEGTALLPDPFTTIEGIAEIAEGVEDFESGENKISDAKKAIKATKASMDAAIAAAMAAAEVDAVGYEFPENVNEDTCTISNGCVASLVYWKLSIKAISDAWLHETVMGDVMILDGDPSVKVAAYKNSRDGFASSFFGGFQFPKYISASGAEPYCKEGAKDCSNGYDCPCAVNYDDLTTLWRARLTKTL